MTRVIVSVGIPGAGKTTTLKPYANDIDACYISPDDIRLERTGSASDQSLDKVVWSEAYDALHAALLLGVDVVFDATNTHADHRRFLTHFCRLFGDDVHLELWFFTTSLEECLKRNAKRTRVVPEEVIHRKARQLLSDRIDMMREGFDVLVFI